MSFGQKPLVIHYHKPFVLSSSIRLILLISTVDILTAEFDFHLNQLTSAMMNDLPGEKQD
jgi:hypothetical protein